MSPGGDLHVWAIQQRLLASELLPRWFSDPCDKDVTLPARESGPGLMFSVCMLGALALMWFLRTDSSSKVAFALARPLSSWVPIKYPATGGAHAQTLWAPHVAWEAPAEMSRLPVLRRSRTAETGSIWRDPAPQDICFPDFGRDGPGG